MISHLPSTSILKDIKVLYRNTNWFTSYIYNIIYYTGHSCAIYLSISAQVSGELWKHGSSTQWSCFSTLGPGPFLSPVTVSTSGAIKIRAPLLDPAPHEVSVWGKGGWVNGDRASICLLTKFLWGGGRQGLPIPSPCTDSDPTNHWRKDGNVMLQRQPFCAQGQNLLIPTHFARSSGGYNRALYPEELQVNCQVKMWQLFKNSLQ